MTRKRQNGHGRDGYREQVPEDSGEIEYLEDGSVSIPVLEEELVVTKRTVVRERIIVRKQWITEAQRIQAELRRERVEIDAPDGPGDSNQSRRSNGDGQTRRTT